MTTLGIDLSSQPEGTAAVLIRWEREKAAAELHLRCTDSILHPLIQGADAVGIDAPFGWPIVFRDAVQSWPHREWNDALRDQLTLRETDHEVMRRHKGRPLSVSADRIALPAMRAMSLLAVHGVTDRSGDGRFFEVYPNATLKAWGLSPKGYKSATAAGASARFDLLRQLRARMPWLHVDDRVAESADALDALLASLTARLAACGFTHKPAPAQTASARTEGWIHVPSKWPHL